MTDASAERTCVIVNPNAGTAELRRRLERLYEQGVTQLEAVEPGEGLERARQAVLDGIQRVIAAGGDGTINEVVNGIVGTGMPATLGIYPMGTGNDLARTLGIPLDPDEAIDVLEAGRVRSIDVISATAGGRTKFGINASAGGFSGQVGENLTPELKATWGPLAYLVGAASTIPDLKDYETTICWDDEDEELIQVLNVIVANGRTVAGGKRVAPMANPEDGFLDVVVVRVAPMARLAEVAARLMAANYVDSEAVFHRKVRRVRVDSKPGMWFNIDGELFANDAIEFTVLPHAIKVIVGPDYRPVPELAVD